jgi:predicted nucleotide-binding protein
MNKVPKAALLNRLQSALQPIPFLKKQRHGGPIFKKWRRDTEIAIAHMFGDRSRHVKDFTSITYTMAFCWNTTPDSEFQKAYVNGLESAAAVLESMFDEVTEYWNEAGDEVSNPPDARPSKPIKVFIIHGRDDGAKEMVARFISTQGIEPIILHEQTNQGRTIIEKFESHAEVGFAIALLTPDDVGALIGHEMELKPRARQNVIFKFGYFIGILGRNRVCALTKDEVEIPSDYAGVLYLRLEDGAWRLRLLKELKAVGFMVDANRAL